MKTLNPNDLGKKHLVEEFQKVSINTFLREAKSKMKEMFLSYKIEIMDKNIELATTNLHYGGVRYWFKCPLCNRRVGTLFINPLNQSIGCRNCLGLEYRKRRYKGMLEGKIA